MFRTNTIKSFSTRNRKQNKEVQTTKKVVNQNKKKVPNVKAVIGVDQFSLTKEDNIITLKFTPQESVAFLNDNHENDGDDDIKLDVTTITTYNDIIKNYTDSDTLNVLLDKLTLKQENANVYCDFLPFQTGTSGERVKKVTFKYKPDESSDDTLEKKIEFANSTISTLQVVNTRYNLITPVESANAQFESANLNDTIPKATITGNYEEAYLTNFRVEGDVHQRKDYTQLIVKGDTTYWKGLPRRDHPSGSTGTNDYWTVYSVNEIVDTGIPVSENSEETKKIGIDNVLAPGAVISTNDSSISFLDVELTEQQKTEAYWENFYVNKITRYSDQVFGFKFQGYRGTELKDATEVVVTIAPATGVSINDQVLTINFGNEEPGFLGETEEINLGTETNPNNVEAVAIYLDEQMSAQVRDNMNNVSTVKLVVSNMRVITQESNPNCNFYMDRIVDSAVVEPTYVAVYYLNASNVYNKHTDSIENLTQQITNLNVIYGEVIEERDKKKLLTPATITNVWNDNKLNLKTITPKGDVLLSEIQTTNCLAINAKLNLVVQGEMPFEWYDKWLPLDNVYVQADGTVEVNPTSTTDLPQFYSINDLPDATAGDEIGIKTVKPDDFEEPAATDVYSWMDMTRLPDFTSVDSKINNSDDKTIFFVNMIKLRDELKDVQIPFSQWNGTTKEESWVVPVEMEYTELITQISVEAEKPAGADEASNYLTITFTDQTEGLFLDPKGDERSRVLDISDNENLSLKMSQSLGSFTTETVPVMLSVDKMRLIQNGGNFNQQFYSNKLHSIEIRYLEYKKVEENWVSNGIVSSYVINTADSNNKVVNRIKKLLTIRGTVSTVNEQKLLEPIDVVKVSDTNPYVFAKSGNTFILILPNLELTYTNNFIVPIIKEVRGINVDVRLINAKFEKGFMNIVVKGEIPSQLYGCIDDNGYLNIDNHHKIIVPELSQKKVLKDGEIDGIIDQINEFPDEDIGINNIEDVNQNIMDLSEETLKSNDPKLANVYLDNVIVSPSTTNDIQMQFTRHVGLDSEGSNITIKQAQGNDNVKAPVDDPLVPLINKITTNTNDITFNINPNDRGTLLVQNRLNYESEDDNNPEQPNDIVIDLTNNKELSKGMVNWKGNNGTTIRFIQEAVILQSDEWTNSEYQTNPDVRLNGDQIIDTITIKWYDAGDASASPVVEPSYKSVTFRKTPTSGTDEKEFKELISTINKLYLVNGTIDNNRYLTTAYPAVDIKQDETTINGIFKKTGDDNNPIYSIESVPILAFETATIIPIEGQIILYQNNKLDTGSVTSSIINKYYLTNIILKNKSNNVFNNLVIKGNIPKWAFEQFDKINGYYLIQQEESTDKWIITNKNDTNTQTYVKYVNILPVNRYGPTLDIGIKKQGNESYLGGEEEQIELGEIKNNFHVDHVKIIDTVENPIENATIKFTSTENLEYTGSNITIKPRSLGKGTVNKATEEIKSFTLKNEGTGETRRNILIVTFKPSNKRNILNGYIQNGSLTNILLDVTGDLHLCKQLRVLKELQNIDKVVIRQEVLIINSNNNDINIMMNGNNNVEKVTIKFFDVTNNESTGEIYERSSTVVTHEISKLYFVYGIVDEHLLTPLSVDNVFITSGNNEDRTFLVRGLKKLLVNTEDDTQINLKCEEGCLKNVYATNVINAIPQQDRPEDDRRTNIVVYGEIPYEIYRDFPFAINDEGIIYPSNNQHGKKDDNSIKYPITTINDFPCIGYSESLDIGIGIKPQNEGEQYPVSILKVPENAIPDNNNNEPIDFGKEGFYVDDVDFTEVKKKTEELEIMFTSHRGFRTLGSKIKVKPKGGDNDGDGSNVMKVRSLNDLYNMMMEPRKYKNQVGLLRSINGNLIQIPDDQILVDGNHLYYLKNKVKGKDRLILATQQPNDYIPVYVIGDKGLTDQGDCVPPEEYMVRLVLAIQGTIMDNDFSMQIGSEVMYMKNINYGVVGNGAFEGSSIESIEVKGNKFNLKIEDIMNSICVRTLDEDTMEKTIKEKTEDSKKTKKIEMTKYIQYMKRVFQTMAYNKRYINEVLGYLSKCVSFEKTRLPSIREDNQGLESVSSEWSETNPNGWIEKFNEDFTQGGINYKVVSGYDYNYKFRDEGKHADLIKNMEDKLKGIYMFSLMERMSETDNEGTADNEYALMKMIDELIAVWLEYYKGVVTPDDDLLNQYSEIEIYEDEQVYKIFEATEEGETKVITCLTGGNEDEQNLETFIQGVLEFFKDEIKTIVGRKEDINGFDIEEFVAYEDPMKGKTEDMISEAELNKMFQEDDNNLIEYSQMLSTIQGERNKLQRQGNKNKFILKFTQTYKGTFFELLGKETKNTDDDSVILGFFMSELKNIVSHERKRGRGYIPDKVDNKRFVRITKIPEFYKGDPLDWINDNYYCNKIFTQSCDNLYLGLQPEIANRITVKGTPEDENPTEFKEKDMIGYYMIKVN